MACQEVTQQVWGFYQKSTACTSNQGWDGCQKEPGRPGALESNKGASGQELWALPEKVLNTSKQEDKQVVSSVDTSRQPQRSDM